MSLLRFKDIIKNDFFDFNKLIKNVDNYLAHLSKDNLESETLLDHSNLVLDYAVKLIKDNQIENNIDKIVRLSTHNIQIQNDMKLFYLKAIYWHDIGKINENFQKEKMKNSFESVDNGISSKHSILSAYLYLLSCLKYINQNYRDKNDKIELISICIYFSLTLWRHHTGLSSSWKEFLNGSEGINICNGLYGYVSKLNIEIDEKIHHVLIGHLKNMNFTKNENYYILSKSLFSLLIISDYYATAQFMNYGNKEELEYKDFGLIDKKFRTKAYKTFYTKQFIDNIETKTDSDFKSFDELEKEKSNENLNHLRNKLFVEVKEKLRLELKKNQNLFYIEAPTGAGKTNLSIMSAVEILKEDSSINKIFYVFPFTTLITQTYDSIKNVLNLNNSEIVQLHSKAKYNQKEESKEDGVYGDEKTNFLDNQFMNYPITLLSHVKFFNIMTGVSKDDNYIFHRLPNSIVIIDEIQTYSPKFWSSIVYLLDSFADKFNIKFIVMSATLPKIGDILNEPNSKFMPLVPNKQKYFSNQNFRKRVDIFTEKKKIKEPKNIYTRVIEESKSYQKLKSNTADKVKTIIEFITKIGADEFYTEAIKENKDFFDEIFILSGTIIEPRRKEIIRFLKGNNDKNILLVTTQVVEAGVDIDMDIGFKEKSLIDSDEQLAGRINRNSSKNGNKLFLFEMENAKAKFVYKGDKRLGISSEYIEIKNNKEEKKDVLESKNFDVYYNQVIKQIRKSNDIPFIDGLKSYIDDIKNLRFKETHIKIIDMESLSVFVPLELDKKIFEEDKETLIELKIYTDKISGEEVFESYKKAILNQDICFTEKNIELKKFASILSKFTFSLAKYQGSGIENLMSYSIYPEEKFGYLVLKREHIANSEDFNGTIIYTYENGLDTGVLKGTNVGMFI